jgi:glycosidase
MKHLTRNLIAPTLILVIVAACAPAVTPQPTATLEPTLALTATLGPGQPLTDHLTGSYDHPWWNDAVFYEIFVRSFADSDGDGIGDFKGLTAKLDYLNDGDPATAEDLGITGIWLMPIHESPSYHGYDVRDYYSINPDYGTMADFEEFLSEAHKRGIAVIIDMVLNHTSIEHPWFTEGIDPAGATHDYYVWANEKPNASNWHRYNDSLYYYGFFWSGMPDLNYNTPAVTDEVYAITEFWLGEKGVDGFRLDAIKYLYEDGREIQHLPSTHAWLQAWHAEYKGINPNAMTIGEVWDPSILVVDYIGDQLDLGFNFDLSNAYVNAADDGRFLPVTSVFKYDLARFDGNQFGAFLANHDQNRIASQLREDPGKLRVAAALLLTGPGVPFLYYGEEIGMLGIKPDEDIRTPMQWTILGGFTEGQPWRALNRDAALKNVERQTDDPDSLLSWYRTLIHLRNENPALRVGETLIVDTGDVGVYSVLRYVDGQIVLVLINLTDEAISDYYTLLKVGGFKNGTYALNPLFGSAETSDLVMEGGRFSSFTPVAELAPFQVLVLELSLK